VRNFSLDRLRSLLCSRPNIFVRHDVDADLGAAIAMARLEREVDVRSSYYLMPCSQYYNLFGPEGREAVRVLQESGHLLALHCDLDQPRDAELADDEILEVVERDFALVDRFYPGLFERDVSFHVPPKSVLWRDIPGVHNAYGPDWRDRYYSDARGRFDYGDPEDHADGEPIQVNLHPEHWMWKNGDFLSPRTENDRAWFEPFFREPIWIPKRSSV
jgi:hypothetical protein